MSSLKIVQNFYVENPSRSRPNDLNTPDTVFTSSTQEDLNAQKVQRFNLMILT